MDNDKQARKAISEAEKLKCLADRQAAAKPVKCWSPPVLTEQEQREQDEYIKLHNLPF